MVIKNFFKILLVLAIIFIGIIIIILLAKKSSKNNQKNLNEEQNMYSDGRKTVESFGDKRFAIIKGFWDSEITWCLFDREKNGVEGTLDYIDDYERVPPYVYTKGEKGYTKLNYGTAEIQQTQDLSKFSEEDQEIFKNFKNTRIQ